MKSLLFVVSTFLMLANAIGQAPSFIFTKNEIEANLKYIASDELGGRRTASKGEQMAAAFLAKELASYGVKPAPGQSDFFQKVPFVNIQPAKSAQLTIGENKFDNKDNLLIINSLEIDQAAEVVFAGHGWVDETAGIDDYKGLDVKGKIVVTVMGLPSGNSPNEVFSSMDKKKELAAERGAIALVELYQMQLPWAFAKGYYNKEHLELKDEKPGKSNIIYCWIQVKASVGIGKKLNDEKPKCHLKINAGETQNLEASNIIGFIEGKDPVLRNEYLVLSAHYDHVGIGKQGGAAYMPNDSIFNGARDNGIGTVALLAAAKQFAQHPPKRSVVLLACTAEEIGMLGSEWFVNHPTVDLSKTAFNLNTDGAGYNATNCISLIGKGLTNIDGELELACSDLGLNVLDDPAPEQNLYERSDNISFAAKGVPAIDFAPCITEMGEEIFKYYHQATDNPDSLDYDYILKFCQAFTQVASLIADKDGKIDWTEKGAKYQKK
ncbi:MAG: M28 family peptidase [Saprospiraceae bacterium]|nr:M28 family peptidase [Saprospiraceae bacterium]